uniref:Pre-mRNA splicing Prp18-interacting factor n=1 Tax=Tanacetum cinerariifolium TaxID=118510 RepID=A0A6L2JBG7_TANCI|nr:hypothetical protein [Tanacetum cinerariifolium]
MSSFNQRECVGYGQPCDGIYCYLCACQQCGVSLINGICLNFTYGDGKPVTCCECKGPLNGGFCSFFNSRAGNSFAYDPNPNSFDNSQNLSDYPPQPHYQTYSCELSGNYVHYGYDCPPQVLFVYNQDPCFNKNFDNNFPQTSPSLPQQYLCCENCGGPHETFQCQPMNQNLYNSNSSGFDQIQPRKDIHELLRKLLEDLQIISEELAEYINSLSWNYLTFYDDDDEYSIQYREYLENSSNAIIPDLPTEEPDNSLSMGDEHLSTILETESDEVIKSSVENLVLIPSEFEGISDDTCDVPLCDNSPPLDVLNDHFEIFSDFNNDCTLRNDDSFEDIDYVKASPPDSELVSLEEGELTSVVMEDILGEPHVHVPDVLPTHPTLMLDSNFIPFDDSLGSDLKDCPDFEDYHARGFVHRPLKLQSLAYGNPIS